MEERGVHCFNRLGKKQMLALIAAKRADGLFNEDVIHNAESPAVEGGRLTCFRKTFGLKTLICSTKPVFMINYQIITSNNFKEINIVYHLSLMFEEPTYTC